MPKRYKVLITGSSGMLGIDLADELRQDYELYGVDLSRNMKSKIHHFYRCDIALRKKTAEIVAGIKPDIVIHAAAWTDVDGCEFDAGKAYRINSEGTRNVALACEKSDATLIYLSTDFVFSGSKKKPYKETDKTHPLNIYGRSKLRGEIAVKRIMKKYFIVRAAWLYGKHGKNFVDAILEKAARKPVLEVVDDQSGSPTYTKDLAKAMHVLLKKVGKSLSDKAQGVRYGVYHVSNSGSVSWYEYARAILKLAGCRTRVIPISSKELARHASRPAVSVLDNTKFVKFTGHGLRHWNDALAEYISKEVRIC